MIKTFVIVLLFALAVSAADMPTFPTEYTANETISSSGQSYQGTTYQDTANNRTRTDLAITASFTIESLIFYDGSTETIYSISNGATCTTTQIPYSGGSGSSNCTTPAYEGTATANGQSCDWWQTVCTETVNNAPATIYINYYWNGQTPVEIDTTVSSNGANTTSSVIYTSFTAGAPDASVFDIPSICTPPSNKFVEVKEYFAMKARF